MSISRAQTPLGESASLPDALASVLADAPHATLVGDDTDCARGPFAAAGMLPGEIPAAAILLPPRAPELSEGVPKGKTDKQHQEAYARLKLVQTYQALQASGLSRGDAAAQMQAQGFGANRTTLDRYEKAHAARGLAGLFSNYEKSGRKPDKRTELTPKEAAAASAAFMARTNRTEYTGSIPEAIRYIARTGQLRPEVAKEFFERERTGRMVPRALTRKLLVPPAVVKQHRNPTRAALDYLSCPGAAMWLSDERTGKQRFVRVGDFLEADDATPNFPVCVPWEIGGDPCSERWGVKVARFQWLVTIDRASRYVPGWSYTMRPRSSYRAEDVVALFHGVFRQHGIWQRLCLERATWEANLVDAMIQHLGIKRDTAWSPNHKVFIEGLFHLIWQKLGDVRGQVGRFMGEEEETNRVLTSCQRGASDPREHFPMLSDALAAFQRATQERNRMPVKSQHWGTWVPEERWLAQQAEAKETGRLRELPAEASWLFAPCMREWTVQGNTVGGSVQIMEGTSIRYDFAADFLVPFAGAKVRVHFDPAAPRADATVVLTQNVRDHRAGEVLGTAIQVNKTARYAREVLGWGEDADMASAMRKRAASAMRREVRTNLAGDQPSLAVTQVRDGEGNAVTIERGITPKDEVTVPPAESTPKSDRLTRSLTPPRRAVNAFRRSTPEEFAAQGDRLAKLAAATRRNTEGALA